MANAKEQTASWLENLVYLFMYTKEKLTLKDLAFMMRSNTSRMWTLKQQFNAGHLRHVKPNGTGVPFRLMHLHNHKRKELEAVLKTNTAPVQSTIAVAEPPERKKQQAPKKDKASATSTVMLNGRKYRMTLRPL